VEHVLLDCPAYAHLRSDPRHACFFPHESKAAPRQRYPSSLKKAHPPHSRPSRRPGGGCGCCLTCPHESKAAPRQRYPSSPKEARPPHSRPGRRLGGGCGCCLTPAKSALNTACNPYEL
jgi:hypothetical protein